MKLGFILFASLITVKAMITFALPASEKKVLEELGEKNIFPKENIIPYNDSLQIRAMTVGDRAKPALLLIHGSPGDWSAWVNIFLNDSVRANYYLIAIDRAGYGETTVPALIDLNDQADVVWQAITYLGIDNDITIIGHSYGGAVVEQLLIDHDSAFELAVLVAPTLSPELMQPRWYNKVARWRWVNYIISKDLKASNIEMLGLPASLRLNEGSVSSITTPIVYIQGKKDILVDHETVDYFRKLKPDGVAYIIIEKMNHFTPWSDPHLITDAILGK